MLSWRLWRALQLMPEMQWSRRMFSARFRRTTTPAPHITIPLVLLLFGSLYLLAGAIWGGVLAYKLCRVVARERAQGTYDTLVITPLGEWGVCWMFAIAILRFDAVLADLRTARIGALFVLLPGVLCGVIGMGMTLAGGFFPLVVPLALLLAYNHIAAISTAALIAVLVAAWGRHDSALVAAALVVLLQTAALLILALAYAVLFPLVYTGVSLEAATWSAFRLLLAQTVTLLISIPAFVLAQELLLRGLWRMVQRQFDACLYIAG